MRFERPSFPAPSPAEIYERAERDPEYRKLVRGYPAYFRGVCASKRFWACWCLIWLPAVCAIAYRASTNYSSVLYLLAVISAVFSFSLAWSLRTGTIDSNLGFVVRELDPVSYKFATFFFWLVYFGVVYIILKGELAWKGAG